MPITIEKLQANIQKARAQESQHRDDAAACAGATQAYEHLLSQMLAELRADNAARAEGEAVLKDAGILPSDAMVIDNDGAVIPPVSGE